MSLIDLGELRGEAEPDLRSRPPRAVGRPLRLALAGALALFTLAASAPAVRPMWAVLLPERFEATEVFPAPDRLYVAQLEGAEPGRPELAGPELVAYAPPPRAGATPRPLWRVSMSPGEGVFGVEERDGLVLVSGNLDNEHPHLTVLDAATGARLARHSGWAMPIGGGGLLLHVDEEGETEAEARVRAVDPASGRTRWALPPSAGKLVYRDRGGAVDRVVVLGESGRAEVRDAASGAVLAARDLGPGAGLGYPDLTLAGDLLLASTSERAGGARITAYAMDTLDRRWERRLPVYGLVAECGEVVCVADVGAGGLSALDPATGRDRWRNPDWSMPIAARGDRLLVSTLGRQPTMRFGVLDAATGRLLADLGRWEMVDNSRPPGPLYVVRRRGEGGLVVAELDVARAGVRVLEVLPDATGECRAAERALACRRSDRTYGWWRLPR